MPDMAHCRVIGGMAIGELLMKDYNLGPGSFVTGATGGVVGAGILQILNPSIGRLRHRPDPRPDYRSRHRWSCSDRCHLALLITGVRPTNRR